MNEKKCIWDIQVEYRRWAYPLGGLVEAEGISRWAVASRFSDLHMEIEMAQ
jgi:hypothetical protein